MAETVAVIPDLPLVDPDQSHDRFQKHRFSRTAAADDQVADPLLECDGDVIEHI